MTTPLSPPVTAPAPTSGFMLSLATMEWLVDQGRLLPTPASPFGFLVKAPRQTPPEERGATAARELGAAPIPALLEALDIASRPETRIRLTTLSSGRPPRQVTLLRRGSSLAQAGFNTQGFLLGEPVPLKDLVTSLVGHLSSQPPGENTDRLLWPQTLRLLIALWPGTGHLCTAGVRMADAVATCQQFGADEAAARALVNEMVALKLVEVRNATVWLDAEWSPWLERLWSGELVDLEVTALPLGEFDQAELRERREQLLFVGPRGRRVLCRLVDGTHFRDLAPGSPQQDGQGEPALALSFLDDELLAGLLGETLEPERREAVRPPEEPSGELSAPRS